MNCPHIVIESTPGVFYSLPVANSLLQGRRREEIVELGDNDKKEDIINADEEMNKAAKMCQSNDCQYKREMQVNENGQSTCVENKRKVFAKKGWKSLNIAEEREKKVLEEKIGFSGQRFLDSECQDHSARAEAIILRRDSMRHIGDWFYPEGEWGWMVLITSLVMNVLSIGLIMSQGQVMVLSINARVGDETNFIKTGKNMIFEHLPDDVAMHSPGGLLLSLHLHAHLPCYHVLLPPQVSSPSSFPRRFCHGTGLAVHILCYQAAPNHHQLLSSSWYG